MTPLETPEQGAERSPDETGQQLTPKSSPDESDSAKRFLKAVRIGHKFLNKPPRDPNTVRRFDKPSVKNPFTDIPQFKPTVEQQIAADPKIANLPLFVKKIKEPPKELLALAANPNAPIEQRKMAYSVLKGYDKNNCEQDFTTFARASWQILEPETPLEWNWHLDYLCDELQYQIMRIGAKFERSHHLIINIPPRTLKSYLVSKALPAWAWAIAPHLRFLTASHSVNLAMEGAVHSRRIIESEWYQEYWGNKYRLTSDQNTKNFYENSKNGYRITTSPGGALGRGGNVIILDDPINAEDSNSELARANCIEWWKKTISTRLNNHRTDMFIIVMQRLHENDLSGFLLQTLGKHFRHVCLPADDSAGNISPPELASRYIEQQPTKENPKPNKLLFPKRLDQAFLDEMKGVGHLGEYGFVGQFLQKPSPSEGGMFKRSWWKFWQPVGTNLPPVIVKDPKTGEDIACPVVTLPVKFDDQLASWDMTFKSGKGTDYVVGQVWGAVGAEKYLLEQVRARMDYPETVQAVKGLYARYPQVSGTLVEEKANGAAIIADLRKTIPGMIPIKPDVSKVARAQPAARQAQAGNLFLPHPLLNQWVDGYIERFAMFPNAKNDDEIDTTSQAVSKFGSLKRVYPAYYGQTVDLKIDWRMITKDMHLVCSEWVDEKTMRTSIVLACYNETTGKLGIFLEAEYQSPQPESVLVDLTRRVRLLTEDPTTKIPYVNGLRKFEWYANEAVFSNPMGGDIKSAYQKIKIYPMEDKKYDDAGSILSVTKMLLAKKLFIDQSCKGVARDLSSWSYDTDKLQQGHNLARAVGLIMSSLYQVGYIHPAEKPYKPYSRERTALLESIKQDVANGNWQAIEQRESVTASNKSGHTTGGGASGLW